MDKEQLLIEIQNMINNKDYDVEELLAVVPENLLKEVTAIVQNHVQMESQKLQDEFNNKIK